MWKYLLVLMFALEATARMLHVPTEYPTIQAAVEVSLNRNQAIVDTVFVHSGIYNEDLCNTNHSDMYEIIIADPEERPVFTGRVTDDFGEFQFKFTNFDFYRNNMDSLLLLQDISVSFKSCRFSNLLFRGYCEYGVTFDDCLIRNCDLYIASHSVYCYRSTFYSNTGNMVLLHGNWDGVYASNCSFIDNEVAAGGCLLASNPDWGEYVNNNNNLYVGNSADYFINTPFNDDIYGSVRHNVLFENSFMSDFLDVLFETFHIDPHICEMDSLLLIGEDSFLLTENNADVLGYDIGNFDGICDDRGVEIFNPQQHPNIDPWSEPFGSLSASLRCPNGVDGASLRFRWDADGNGQYDDTPDETWQWLPEQPNDTLLHVFVDVQVAECTQQFAYEFAAQSAARSWQSFSGQHHFQGIEDDPVVHMAPHPPRPPRTFVIPDDVPDLAAVATWENRCLLQDGDTLLVRPGTWAAGVSVGAVNLTIRGDGRPEDVILQAPVGTMPVLSLGASPTPGITFLENLTFLGGSGDVVADSVVLFMRDCRLPNGRVRSVCYVPTYSGRMLDARHVDAQGFEGWNHGMVLNYCNQIGSNASLEREEEFFIQAEQQGRDRDVESGVLWVSQCRFENYSTHYPTSALSSVVRDGLIDRCTFVNNRISLFDNYYAPSVNITAPSSCIMSCLFVDNSVFGSLMDDYYLTCDAIAKGSSVFANNTVINNQANCYPVDDPRILNAEVIRENLFVSNRGHPITCEQSSCNLFFDNRLPWYNEMPWTAGNCGDDQGGEVWADPLFCDPENGDYRLLPGSPAWTPNHQDTAPGCGLLGAYGLCAPQVGPIEIRSLRLVQAPLRARLEIAGATPGLTLHIYEADGLDGPWRELRTLVAADSLLEVELPLGAVQPERRLYRATQDEPGEVRVGPYVWSDFARTPLPEPPPITELERLRKLGLPWKPVLE